MTEFELQRRLTDEWLVDGVDLGGERLVLAAWEVMFPSWDINDAHRRWNEPSVDFVAVDEQGHLVAIELKTKIIGIQPVWAVLCQVTHRAVLMSRTDVTGDRLIDAHDSCLSGADGRVSRDRATPLWERHRRFFDRLAPFRAPRRDVRRVVAAVEFGDKFETVVDEFNALPVQVAIDRICSTSERIRREVDRLRTELPISEHELMGPVETLSVPAKSVAHTPSVAR